MTKLTFFRTGNHYVGFRCEGHSDYADRGEDIVCAAISSVVEYCSDYLSRYSDGRTKVLTDTDNAVIELRCTEPFSEADRHFKTLLRFSESLTAQYPENINYDILEV